LVGVQPEVSGMSVQTVPAQEKRPQHLQAVRPHSAPTDQLLLGDGEAKRVAGIEAQQ
jgi:hypothetical protein